MKPAQHPAGLEAQVQASYLPVCGGEAKPCTSTRHPTRGSNLPSSPPRTRLSGVPANSRSHPLRSGSPHPGPPVKSARIARLRQPAPRRSLKPPAVPNPRLLPTSAYAPSRNHQGRIPSFGYASAGRQCPCDECEAAAIRSLESSKSAQQWFNRIGILRNPYRRTLVSFSKWPLTTIGSALSIAFSSAWSLAPES